MDAKSAAMLAGLMGGGTVQRPSPQAPPQPPAGEDAMEMD